MNDVGGHDLVEARSGHASEITHLESAVDGLRSECTVTDYPRAEHEQISRESNAVLRRPEEKGQKS